MTPKTILVCLTTKEHAATLLNFAVPMARKYGAHLIGLHTLEAIEVYPGIAMHIDAGVFTEFSRSQEQEADAIQAIFDAHTKAEEFVCEYRRVKAQSKTAADRIVESARAADLVIMAHADEKADRYDQRGVQRAVIQQSGRPVIVLPLGYDGSEIGKKIVLGWSDTREAARAAHDLLMVADPGAEITVLRVERDASDEMDDSDLLDLSSALARHGLKVNVRHLPRSGHGIAEVMMKCAFEEGAGLVVTGAFGHSNMYDFVVGATSHSLLRDAKLPVLFSK